jgi:hypothetical protein
MTPEGFTELISQLSPEEQAAVHQFVKYLRNRRTSSAENSFLAAVDEFIATHPELLRRLAQ